MKILVMGGSYFLGKCFVELAGKKHDITVLNRGSRPLGMPWVKEICADRHDAQALCKLKNKAYDVVVDFCAYEPKDITSVFCALEGAFKQYIFVSTVDVYEHGTGKVLDESAPFETRHFQGEAGAYIAGKIALEHELVENAGRYQVRYTSIRPAFIYGPGNYAPREEIYFRWIMQAGQILHPVDATGEFQMVFVEDVARAILNSIGNEEAWDQAVNLAPPAIQTYDSFAKALAQGMKVSFEKVPVTVQVVNERGIMLPFPLTKEESNWYDGNKALKLITQYTSLAEGIQKTIQQNTI